MEHNIINKKEVRKEAKQLLLEGRTKQETFNILKEKYKDPKDVADIVHYTPSKKAIIKYGKWNYLLLALLIFTTIFLLIATPYFWSIIYFGPIIYIVARMLTKYYTFVSALSAIGLIVTLVVILESDMQITSWDSINVTMILLIPSLILPIWLSRKISPDPTETKEKYINNQGIQKIKLIYEFKDD